MKKTMGLVLLIGALLSLANSIAGAADSFTTGFTFTLPDSFPLHNVYVGAQASLDPVRPEDVLLPGNPARVGGAVTPHGFDVPVGKRSG